MSDLFPSHDDIPDDIPEAVKGCLHILTLGCHLALIGIIIYLFFSLIFS